MKDCHGVIIYFRNGRHNLQVSIIYGFLIRAADTVVVCWSIFIYTSIHVNWLANCHLRQCIYIKSCFYSVYFFWFQNWLVMQINLGFQNGVVIWQGFDASHIHKRALIWCGDFCWLCLCITSCFPVLSEDSGNSKTHACKTKLILPFQVHILSFLTQSVQGLFFFSRYKSLKHNIADMSTDTHNNICVLCL